MASRSLWQRLLKPDAHADDGALPKKSTVASWPRRLGLVVLWLALVPGAYFLAAVIISAVTPPLNQLLVALSLTLPVRQSVIMALVFLLTLAIVWAVATFCFRTPVSLRTFGLQRTMRWRDIGLGIAAYIIYMAAALFLVDLVGRFVPGFQANQAQDLGPQTVLFDDMRIARQFTQGRLRQVSDRHGQQTASALVDDQRCNQCQRNP